MEGKILGFNCFPIKVIKKSYANGLIDTGYHLNDIGIFGEVYGIQSLNDSSTGEFFTDNLKIDFYFDEEKTKIQKKAFDDLFRNSKSEYLTTFF